VKLRPILLITSKDGEHIVAVSGGMHHSLALTSSGAVYGFGRGDSGQLGLPHLSASGGGEAGDHCLLSSTFHALLRLLIYCDKGACLTTPQRIPIAMDGQAQSSSGSSTNPVTISAISCGGNHNLALSTSNEVYSWGFGDMLALGHGKEKDEPVPKKLSFQKTDYSVIKIVQVAG
jgi:regulator of chromosome condensation